MSKQKVFRQWYYVYVEYNGNTTYVPVNYQEVKDSMYEGSYILDPIKEKYAPTAIIRCHMFTPFLPEIKNILTK